MTIVDNPSFEGGPPREATKRWSLISGRSIQEAIEKSRLAHPIQKFCRYLRVRLAGVLYVCTEVLFICDLIKRSCTRVSRVDMGILSSVLPFGGGTCNDRGGEGAPLSPVLPSVFESE